MGCKTEKRKQVHGGIFMSFFQLFQNLRIVAGERFGHLRGKFRFSSQKKKERVEVNDSAASDVAMLSFARAD